MSTDPWREKYRKSLLAQESLENELNELKQAYFASILELASLNSDQDKLLDERLSAIRVCARNDDVKGLARMLSGLARITEEAGERRDHHWQKTVKALLSMTKPLLKQAQGESKAKLKRWRSRLGKTIMPLNLLAEQLSELSDLSQQVSPEPDKSTSLFSKLLNKKADQTDDSTNPIPIDSEVEPTPLPSPESILLERELNVELDSSDTVVVNRNADLSDNDKVMRSSTSVMATHTTDAHELGLVAPKVTQIMDELIAHFEPPAPCIADNVRQTRFSLNQGLDATNIVPIFENIRDLVLQASLATDDEYRDYLSSVDQELSKIGAALGLAADFEQQRQAAVDTLHSSVTADIKGINAAFDQHSEVTSLKQTVSERLQDIEAALETYKTQQAQPSDSLVDQLNHIMDQMRQMEADAKQTKEQLALEKKRALTDPLTLLANRQAYQERIFHEYSRWQRYKHPLTLAIADIDHFKKVNDTYGHQTGDKVLKVVASMLSKRLREVDFVSRFGGEEFVIIFPETTAKDAFSVLDTIRLALSAIRFSFKGEPVTITASFGLAEFIEDQSIDQIFERADEALYQAKASGRNQCLIAGTKNITTSP